MGFRVFAVSDPYLSGHLRLHCCPPVRDECLRSLSKISTRRTGRGTLRAAEEPGPGPGNRRQLRLEGGKRRVGTTIGLWPRVIPRRRSPVVKGARGEMQVRSLKGDPANVVWIGARGTVLTYAALVTPRNSRVQKVSNPIGDGFDPVSGTGPVTNRPLEDSQDVSRGPERMAMDPGAHRGESTGGMTAKLCRLPGAQSLSEDAWLCRQPYASKVDLEQTRHPVESRWGHQVVFVDV
jgi:hypothetical protein